MGGGVRDDRRQAPAAAGEPEGSLEFSPSFVTVYQGDTVHLVAFVVNGDEHEVRVTDPGGATVVERSIWNRGRQYQALFVAEKTGVYQLVCSTHAPTMLATIAVLSP